MGWLRAIRCIFMYQAVATRNIATTREISTLGPERSATRLNISRTGFSEVSDVSSPQVHFSVALVKRAVS
jgi:hypothetical protein